MSRRATPPAGDQELESALRAAQAGDGNAFRLLYRDLQPRLLRYLRALVGTEAEDVAADAWLQIARDLGSFTGDYDRFRGWASTIARHRALDHVRRVGRRPDASVDIDALTDLVARDDTERDALERLSTDSAIALICDLPRDQAEAVLLRVVVGLDAKEAGRVLGKRSGAVRTAAYRGLRRLAERLGTQPAEQPDMGPPAERSDTGPPAERPGAAPSTERAGSSAERAAPERAAPSAERAGAGPLETRAEGRLQERARRSAGAPFEGATGRPGPKAPPEGRR